MSRAVAQGSKAGIATAAGVSVGLLGHTLLAALGLGSLLLASELLFAVLKLVGAAYLIYLGLKLSFNRAARLELEQAKAARLDRLFLTGALSNLSNPKVTIFYFAFLPQFIASDVQNPTVLLLVLGASFAALTFLVKGPVGYAGVLSAWLRARPAVLRWIDRTSGAVLVGLGARGSPSSGGTEADVDGALEVAKRRVVRDALRRFPLSGFLQRTHSFTA